MSKVRGIAAVVLNYKTWEDAVNCIIDLKAQDYADKHIVVVENGSGNGSAAELKKRFESDPLVTVLVSETNLGFAKGNNLGIRYAHEKLGFDTVFVVNSDTRIPPSLFSEIAALDPTGIGTVSPYVADRDGRPQYYPVNCDNICAHAFRTIWYLFKANVASLKTVNRIYSKIRGKKHAKHANDVSDGTIKKYVLQGCAYFLMPDFFKHYQGIYPRTFLYWEEIDLLIMLKRAGLASVNADTSAVIHFGGGSTGSRSKEALRFRIRHSNRSMFKSLPLLFGMSEKSIRKCIDSSRQFTSEL